MSLDQNTNREICELNLCNQWLFFSKFELIIINSFNSEMSKLKMYTIPDRFRRTENMHIIFWLVKDISWAMLWKPIGLACSYQLW